MSDKKKKNELTYFLDHPQIKRHPSPGNGNRPGSLSEKINFGGKNTNIQNAKVKANTPKASSGKKASAGSSTGKMMSSIRKAFGGK